MSTKPIPVILDTDPGDDIDDAYAIALCAVAPQIDLRAVTTVYGDTVERSRLARSILVDAGRGDVPVAAGCAGGMSPRHRGGLDRLISRDGFNQAGLGHPESALPKADPRHAVDLIIDTIMSGNGDIVPVTIGAMTNLAMALVKEPRLRERIPRVVCMAAEFKHITCEWNIRCDPIAAELVFNSGIPMEITPWDIGRICTMTPDEVTRLDAAPSPLAKMISVCTKRWMERHPGNHPHLYDPVAIAAMIQPDLCTWVTGTVKIDNAGGPADGVSVLHHSKEGKHRVQMDVNREAAVKAILDQICGAQKAAAR